MSAKTDSADGNEFGFQIAPMVDVVFVLLLFFMAIAGSNVNERFFKIPLPSGGDFRVPIFLDIDAAGNVAFNGQQMSASPDDRELKQLSAKLTDAMNISTEDPVSIRPALDSRYERVVQVVSACRAAQVKNLSFQ